jgi:hypothetical protein
MFSILSNAREFECNLTINFQRIAIKNREYIYKQKSLVKGAFR